jgi:hypothetical protein
MTCANVNFDTENDVERRISESAFGGARTLVMTAATTVELPNITARRAVRPSVGRRR